MSRKYRGHGAGFRIPGRSLRTHPYRIVYRTMQGLCQACQERSWGRLGGRHKILMLLRLGKSADRCSGRLLTGFLPSPRERVFHPARSGLRTGSGSEPLRVAAVTERGRVWEESNATRRIGLWGRNMWARSVPAALPYVVGGYRATP